MRALPEVLGGRYEVGRELGSGGMAVVVEATDRLLGRRVAVKLLFPHLVGDPDFLERFRREARVAARLSHPNVVAVYDVGTGADGDSAGTDYIVMELVEGRTVRQELAEGPMPLARAAAVARDVCDALEAAHAVGLVHRDVKPANIMITDAGRVKVMDFGIARAADADRLTRTGLAIGTAQYASPEQLTGGDVDGRADVYSLGCCLYEMLAGTAPFTGESPLSVAFRQVHETPAPLHRVAPGLPAALAAVVGRAMEKDRALRYQSAAEMGAELSRVLGGGAVAGAALAGAAGAAAAATTTLPAGSPAAGGPTTTPLEVLPGAAGQADGPGSPGAGPAVVADGPAVAVSSGAGAPPGTAAGAGVGAPPGGPEPGGTSRGPRRGPVVLGVLLVALAALAVALGMWQLGGTPGPSSPPPASSRPATATPGTPGATGQTGTGPSGGQASSPAATGTGPSGGATTPPASTTSAAPETTPPRTTAPGTTPPPTTAPRTTARPTSSTTAGAPGP